jgi:TPR repeat protein
MQKNFPLHFLISGFLVLMFASGCKTAPPNVALGYSYLIQTGDTLEAVAVAYQKQGVDVTVDQIMAENPGIRITTNTEAGAHTLMPETGQQIFIPDKKRVKLEELMAKADKGDAIAQCNLGYRYEKGNGVPQDYTEAIKWYRRAAKQGQASAQCNLGQMYYHGKGVRTNLPEALKWFLKAANQDDASAQYNLGIIYDFGEGVKTNHAESLNWFLKAGNHGLAEAQYDLGCIYSHAQSQPVDYAEAYKWFRRASELGMAKAQFNLAMMYNRGDGIEKDNVEAAKWYRRAAEQGDAEAENAVGYEYQYGEGVETNHSEALKWYRKSAENGYEYAQYNLGLMYANGEGVETNAAEAFKWYTKAAEQGLADAQFNLGSMYGNGESVPLDNVQTLKWFSLAAANGNELANECLPKLASTMTTNQIAEGQRLANDFKPVVAQEKSDSPSSDEFFDNVPVAENGTGFFITDDGYLISNYHVIKDATQIRLITADGIIRAEVVGVDATNDLALLKATGQFSALPIANSRGVKLGNTVVTVGFPNPDIQGFSPKFAKGDIASLAGGADEPRYFQISVPVQPGNSGGALVDEHGNVVGVVSAKLDELAVLEASGSLPENVNYAVKSSFLLKFLESITDVSNKLKAPHADERKIAEIVNEVQRATVMVVVYNDGGDSVLAQINNVGIGETGACLALQLYGSLAPSR